MKGRYLSVLSASVLALAIGPEPVPACHDTGGTCTVGDTDYFCDIKCSGEDCKEESLYAPCDQCPGYCEVAPHEPCATNSQCPGSSNHCDFSAPGDGLCVLCGTAGNDEITGTPGDDVICGKGGSDIIDDGGEGDDHIDGGPGADRITIGAGDDEAYGGSGNDTIDGFGGGSDLLNGGDGDDEITSIVIGERRQPEQFSLVQGQEDWHYRLFCNDLTTSNPAFTFADVCPGEADVNYAGPEWVLEAEGGFIMHDTARDLALFLPPNGPLGLFLSSISLVAPETGTYQVTGDFARASACENGGDGVTVSVAKVTASGCLAAEELFSAFIASSHVVDPDDPFSGTGAVSFDFPVDLAAGDSLAFRVINGPPSTSNTNTNDITALRAIVSLGGGGADDVVGTRLCGAGGNDNLEAVGPRHQCLEGGHGNDECTYRFGGTFPVGEGEVGTARSCEDVVGNVVPNPNPTCATGTPQAGLPCTTDADCESSPGAGDGTCNLSRQVPCGCG